MNIPALYNDNICGLTLYARQWCGSEAEDVVSEAFLRLIRCETPPENPKNWLYRVVRNAAIDRTRRFRWFSAKMDNWFDTLPDKSNPFDGVELTEALEQLPAIQRETVIAKIWGNLTLQEIAEVQNRSTSTVHREYLKGIETLREKM
ncbi:MAG: sigma-70 family RNA polymerase sigma factor [Planctomycetaceae bacterium]|nr:sigma-70 family RNA polymerase sigma factor [Planctomycetaceae bacterium]